MGMNVNVAERILDVRVFRLLLIKMMEKVHKSAHWQKCVVGLESDIDFFFFLNYIMLMFFNHTYMYEYILSCFLFLFVQNMLIASACHFFSIYLLLMCFFFCDIFFKF